MISRGYRERVTLRMDGSGAVTGPAIRDRLEETFGNRRHGQIVVQELGVLHEHQGIPGVQVAYVGMDDCGDYTGRG